MAKISSSEILKLRTELYLAVIASASRNALDKSEVPRIADGIWDAIIKPISDELAHSEKDAKSQK